MPRRPDWKRVTVDLSPGTHRSLDVYLENVNSELGNGVPGQTKAGLIRGLLGSKIRGDI